MQFKFKLTEEASREMEEKLKKEAEEKAAKAKPLAQCTTESSLIMARISHDRYKDTVKVGVPKHRFNEHFTMYVREQDNVYAYDPDRISEPGDWVLLRRLPEALDENVNHKVEKVVYRYGHIIDPLTGRRTYGIKYDDDLERLEKIKLDI